MCLVPSCNAHRNCNDSNAVLPVVRYAVENTTPNPVNKHSNNVIEEQCKQSRVNTSGVQVQTEISHDTVSKSPQSGTPVFIRSGRAVKPPSKLNIYICFFKRERSVMFIIIIVIFSLLR